MKVCTQCNIEKEFEAFSPKGDRYSSKCKECLSKNKREAYIKHPKPEFSIPEKQICTLCLVEKDILEFYKNKNCATYHKKCITCLVRNASIAKKILQDEINQLKAVPCKDCNQSYPYYVMDFDHRDGVEKKFNISDKIRHGARNLLLEEISKCDVVCANCHRIRTHIRRI